MNSTNTIKDTNKLTIDVARPVILTRVAKATLPKALFVFESLLYIVVDIKNIPVTGINNNRISNIRIKKKKNSLTY